MTDMTELTDSIQSMDSYKTMKHFAEYAFARGIREVDCSLQHRDIIVEAIARWMCVTERDHFKKIRECAFYDQSERLKIHPRLDCMDQSQENEVRNRMIVNIATLEMYILSKLPVTQKISLADAVNSILYFVSTYDQFDWWIKVDLWHSSVQQLEDYQAIQEAVVSNPDEVVGVFHDPRNQATEQDPKARRGVSLSLALSDMGYEQYMQFQTHMHQAIRDFFTKS